MSISPASSMVQLGRDPATSSTSWVSRWKTGAMFTYEIRPSLIIGVGSSVSCCAGRRSCRGSCRLLRRRVPPAPRDGRRRRGSPGHAQRSRAPSRETARAHRSPRRGREPRRPSRERLPDDLLAGGKEGGMSACRRAGRCRDLPGLDGLAAAVEDVVDDLERDPEQSAEVGVATSEDARRREERAGLERTTLEIGVHRRRGIVPLQALERFAARERQRRLGEHRDRRLRAPLRRARRRPRRKVVARRARGVGAVRGPRRSTAAADVRAVDVVVDQRRHVDELHGDPFDHRRLGSRRGGEERERRPQPLAARSQRVGADRCDGAGMGRDDQLEALLDRDEVLGEPVDRADGLERANDGSRTRRRSAARRSSRRAA